MSPLLLDGKYGCTHPSSHLIVFTSLSTYSSICIITHDLSTVGALFTSLPPFLSLKSWLPFPTYSPVCSDSSMPIHAAFTQFGCWISQTTTEVTTGLALHLVLIPSHRLLLLVHFGFNEFWMKLTEGSREKGREGGKERRKVCVFR